MRLRIIIIVFAALVLGSCSCSWQVERLRRHCPECFATAAVTDTIPLPPLTIEALAPIQWQADGIGVIDIHRHDLDLWVRLDTDTAYVSLTTPPDTVVITRTVTVPADPCPAPPVPWTERIIIVILTIVIIIILRLTFKH